MRLLHVIPLLVGFLLVGTLCSNAIAAEVRVGMGFSVPPYVISAEDRGLEVDIIREALALVGHEAVFTYLPNSRLPIYFAEEKVDCVATHFSYDLTKVSGRKGFSSNQTTLFQNYAISLKNDQLAINSIEDLTDKRVLAFQEAPVYLGPAFAEMAAENPNYSELADQSLHVRMLLAGRVDVLISDKHVFLWWKKQFEESDRGQCEEAARSVTFHPIFPSSPRHVVFLDKGLRDDFNRGLEQLKASGKWAAIVKEYAEPACDR